MGGDRTKAEVIVNEMSSEEKTYYALAQAKLLPDTANMVGYWQKVGQESGMNAQVLEELGRAYLLKSDTENGEKYFLAAIEADQSKKHLTMNLVRYHLMAAQQDPAAKEAHLKSATDLVNGYLQSSPEPLPPLKAYGYSTLSMISMFGGDQDAGNKYREMADSIDPYYSKATGMAPDMLYCKPDEVKIQYSSFFMPF
jgi:tetratricopeptide (TPR) repeat protein